MTKPAKTTRMKKPRQTAQALATTPERGGASGTSLESTRADIAQRVIEGAEASAAVVTDAAQRPPGLLQVTREQHTEAVAIAQVIVEAGEIKFRPYQEPVFMDRESGILILHWSRQIGKSFTLASWAVDRLLSQLQRYDSWLITVLSNSRDNGAEFVIKCQDVCRKLGMIMEKERDARIQEIGDAAVYVEEDHSPDIKYENMRMEVRITVTIDGRERTGRIKVLAANPRTARGFSGDLILDEFAFHEDSKAIWDAAEPILSSNQEFLCRIASTGNGKHNMFYRMAAGPGPNDGTPFLSEGGYRVSRVTRTEAWKQGVKVYDPNTRKSITPDEAEAKALDKRSYKQNYECQFNDENMVLLTHELISAAERDGVQIDSQAWSAESIARFLNATGWIEWGFDVGRNRDLSVMCVIERIGTQRRVIGLLRMSGMRLPTQQVQLDIVCAAQKFRRGEIDMTGIGLGLCEYSQEKWGDRIAGVNFGSTEPISARLKQEGRKQETARVTEIMATDLLGVFEDKGIEIPMDHELRDDLRKPERITSPGGRVSIAATRDEAGHADHFWAIALAVRAGFKDDDGGAIKTMEGIRTGGNLGSTFRPRRLRNPFSAPSNVVAFPALAGIGFYGQNPASAPLSRVGHQNTPDRAAVDGGGQGFADCGRYETEFLKEAA